MTVHRFFIGQHVTLDHNALTRTAGMVEVMRHLPSDVDGSPQYRVRVIGDGFERLAKEVNLSVAIPPAA